MVNRPGRRRCLWNAAASGTAVGLSNWSWLAERCSAQDRTPEVDPELIRFHPDIEPVVRLIEDTPRDKCAIAVAEQLRRGLPYRQLLAALYLAAIRAAKWHGGFHAYDHNAYVVHSAHQLSLELPAGEHLLPAFYALNSFKGMQKAYPASGSIKRTLKLTGDLPTADNAAEELDASLKNWDAERAERAVAALARSNNKTAIHNLLWKYAGRDFGFIGHLAILVSNSTRLLETIGWQHSEPILRYVVAALAGWEKDHANGPDVKPYWPNLERVEKSLRRLPPDWAGSAPNDGLTKDLLLLVRDRKSSEACDLAIERLTSGKAQAGAIWDAVHLAAGEQILSTALRRGARPDGDALHANTAANALHYAFRASSEPATQLLLTLQALAWMTMYGELTKKKPLMEGNVDIALLQADPLESKPDAAIEEILASRTASPHDAARLAFAFAQHHAPEQLLKQARRLLVWKSTGDPHDLKFPAAICEDLDLVSPQWRPHMLAAATYSFWGRDLPDHAAIASASEALRML